MATDIPALIAPLLRDYALDLRGIHGPGHWLRVARNGRALAALTPEADAEVVELFGLLHDSRRQNEHRDREHGQRAADFAESLAADGLIGLEMPRLRLLMRACARHEMGEVSADPTIGCCWDSDRLDLARLGIRPRMALMSTMAARDDALLAEAWDRGWSQRDLHGLAREWGVTLPR